jgi:hypothetical protein
MCESACDAPAISIGNCQNISLITLADSVEKVARLHRQAHQVTERQERAHSNENCHADGEQNPDEFNLLGIEVKPAHCSSARLRRCGNQYSATLR